MEQRFEKRNLAGTDRDLSHGPLSTLRAIATTPRGTSPAKARTARCAREQDRGGGRARRVGTRSGFGRPGGPGLLSGVVCVLLQQERAVPLREIGDICCSVEIFFSIEVGFFPFYVGRHVVEIS